MFIIQKFYYKFDVTYFFKFKCRSKTKKFGGCQITLKLDVDPGTKNININTSSIL